ncbi:hypothetical protein N9B73_07065 [Verrucomicrobiales bacterium]|nr:hypothetical protein [Verrucomicrobiales bacterium]
MKMNAEDQSLWNRLKAFHIGDETAIFGFEHRLARENGWTVDFAERVIEEYKCFMFLAVRSGHRVTPSEEIDQVWHLHLVYTQSYWKEFCEETLEHEINHGPTKGGAAE